MKVYLVMRQDCLSSLDMRVIPSFSYTNSLLKLALPALLCIVMILKMDLTSSSKKLEAFKYSCKKNKQ